MPKEQKSLRFFLLASTTLIALPLAAEDLPTGANVVHGSVGITTPDAGRMAIHQSTNSAIVGWKGFSIGENARVDIQQPSAGSAILNRVTGATPSTIAGQLNANGQVFLVNPNGVAISPTGTVKTGAFVASTLDITDEDFLAGRHEFRGDGQSASVANHGTIEIGPGGYAALLGGQVENTGTVSVALGRIGLGAGELMTLDVSGDGFLSVTVPSDGATQDALIRHSGRLSADGGRIEIAAATARQAARRAVNLSGVVEARTVSGRSGEIVLSGGAGGAVTVSGRIDASAPDSLAVAVSPAPAQRPQRGGAIDITGNDIALAGAAIDASGAAGGGAIRIGGDYKGGGILPTARTTSVDATTQISADALGGGDGGRVIIWSEEATRFDGTISARGGPDGGDGGFAEVSGKQHLAFAGLVDLRAPQGAAGTLLLDPFDILISDDAEQNIVDQGSGFEADFVSIGTPSIMNATVLQDQLDLSNVTVETGPGGDPAGGDITLAVPLNWGSGNELTLIADSDIFLNAAITATPFDTGEGLDGGDIVLDAAGSIFLNGDISAPLGSMDFQTGTGSIVGAAALSTANGSIDFASAADIDLSAGSISAGESSISVSAGGSAAFGAISNFGGSVGINAGGDIGLADVEASQGDLQLGTSAGNINSTGTINADQADVLIIAGSSGGGVGSIGLNVLNFGDSAFASLTAEQNISYGALSSSTTSPTITAGVNINAGQTSAGNGVVDFSAGGDFTSTGHFTAGLGGFVVDASNILLNADMAARSISLTAAGNLVGNATVGTSTGGSIAMTATAGAPGSGNVNVAAISSLQSSSVSVAADGSVAFGSYTGSGLGGFNVSAVNDISIGAITTTSGDLLDFVASGVITVDGAVNMQGSPSQLFLSANGVDIRNSITIPDGLLLIASNGAVGANANSAIAVDSFILSEGFWTQLQDPLPTFSAQDFLVSSGSVFLRALDGDGSAGNPYLIGDVYGLQGMQAFLTGNFALANDIDAGVTASWGEDSSLSGFAPLGSVLDPFIGVFDGAGHTVAGLTIDATSSEGAEPVGLFGVTAAGAMVRNVELADPSIAGFGQAGALVGINSGTIQNAAVRSSGASESAVSGTDGVGGLVGANAASGAISQASADINVFGSSAVGGLVGSNAGTISLAYAEGDVSGFNGIGGLAGSNSGTLVETYAVGFVDDASAQGAGGLVGLGNPAAVSASFWDIDTTGQTTSAGGIGLETEIFQNAATFVPLAGPLGWNFQTDWAPPNSYPVLYAVTPVIFADAAELTAVYGFPIEELTLGQTFGGPGLFALGPAGDSLDTSGAFSTPALPDGNVGSYATNIPATLVSAEGVIYSVVPSPGTLTITPAALTIAADNQIKLQGMTFVFNGTEFTLQGLVPGDSVTSVTLTSDGAPAEALASGSPYPIFASNPQGTGIFVDGVANYDITFVPGEMTVISDEGDGVVTPAFFAPEFELPNPGDEIVYGGPISNRAASPVDEVASAEETLRFLEELAGDMDDAVEACRLSEPEVEDYLDCLGTALDQYATQMDAIALDLPEPLRGVSATIQQASREIAEAREDAVQQLATATTTAERRRIRRQAAERARASVATATAEIRKQIALIRADEPQVARLQAEQGDAITAALDIVGADLERAVGL